MEFAELSRWVPRIERYLRDEYASDRRDRPAFTKWTGALEEFTLRGGKRFRALLVLAGYHIATHRDPAPALPAAAALEHFQSWMLIHDDIIDHAETRRGGPTIHRRLTGEVPGASGSSGAESYGLGMGITLGDLEEPSTVRALLAVRVPAERRLRAIAEYARMTRDTAYGQLLDIHSGARPVSDVAEEDVLTVHRLKTSVYTVASPLRIGAILGGGGPALLKDLETIGVDLGIAFQLRDDVLGAGFDEGQSGKSANDLVEGKRTLLVVRAWSTSDATARAVLFSVLGNAAATPEAVERARTVIRSSGSLEHSETEIERLAKRAEARIGRSRALRTSDRALLREIEDRLVHRST
jgi:geranylgeranyl diphosphate synthase, type I